MKKQTKLLEQANIKLNEILVGDVISRLGEIPTETIDSVVTSVPFFGVRDYGVYGQWGLEKDVGMYQDRMSEFMREIKRVLKPEATAWIEIGDKRFNNSWMGIPEEFLVNQKKQGFNIVSKPIWYKRNGFPLSTKIMFSPKYTNIYGFSKSSKIYFDLDAVKIPAKTVSKPFNARVRDTDKGKFLQKATQEEKENHNSKGEKKQDNVIDGTGKQKGNYKGFNGRYDHEKILKNGKNPSDFIDMECDVFDITVKPLKGIEHYATFPEALAERLIKVSCPKNGIVLDPFMGAGTVALVANKLKRKWLGIELKPEFVYFAYKRINQIINNDLLKEVN